ncbi:hypothetical protein PVAND_007675 [Polypedilum vanderplanki]|uniref:Uncharacterized protein n=1 Tax=Polypedilum vanderplanki TaxID=319348 RepID=A0A9J6C837_POLVA|nr:hypothetical protein PVAND_007675 [Polypedilum vanderplanki]
MYQTSRENLIKVKEFLEDIHIYLNKYNNTEHDEEEKKKNELIENCKHIQRILEFEFHPHDDDDIVDSASYLDMNGAATKKSTISDENEIDFKNRVEYIEMNKRKSASNSQRSENPYNIYEATITLSNQDFDTCPFTGLPAVHLKLMCSPITGLLTRLEKKLFFGQSKDFYAGILDKWILLYPSKSNDMKPSEHFYPKSVEKLKGENQFVINYR